MAVKVYGVRIEESVIKDFKEACMSFPVALRPSALIDSYMRSIIEASNQYKKTGELSIEIVVGGNSSFMVSSGGKDSMISSNGSVSEIITETHEIKR